MQMSKSNTESEFHNNYAKKQKRNKIIKYTVYYFFAVLFAIYFFVPLFALITRAFMTIDEVKMYPTPLLPKSFLNFKNFTYIFTMESSYDVNFLVAIWNSIQIMILKVIGLVLSSFIVAFSLSRIKFRGANILFSLGMVTIMLPGIVTTIPFYSMYKSFGWLNTLYPLWVPAWFGGGMTVIFLEMQFIKSIPKTYDEAAIIDGANYLQIAFNIVFPLVLPVLIFQAVGCAIGSWNDFMGPLTYISTSHPEKFTFPLAYFVEFKNAVTIQQQRPNVKAATSIIMMLPVCVLFAIFHKQMINGVSLGSGIKG